jgi:hypothetical protein
MTRLMAQLTAANALGVFEAGQTQAIHFRGAWSNNSNHFAVRHSLK